VGAVVSSVPSGSSRRGGALLDRAILPAMRYDDAYEDDPEALRDAITLRAFAWSLVRMAVLFVVIVGVFLVLLALGLIRE
jgi:hypothetical protein